MRSSVLVPLLLAAAAPAQSTLCTTLTSNGGGSSGWGHFLDVSVTNPGGVLIRSLDVNSSAPALTAFTLDVWVTSVGYGGKDTDASLWRRVATGMGVTAGRDQPSTVDVTDFHLPAGSFGMAVYYNGVGPAYTNGNGSNQSYANVDLALALGIVRTGLFSGIAFLPRVWNGCIDYTPAPAGVFGFLGEGCPGSTPTATLTSAPGSLPRIGQTHTVVVGGLAAQSSGAFLLIGLSSTTWNGRPLPQELGAFGMPGCLGRVRPDATLFLPAGMGAATHSPALPNNPSLVGLLFYLQAVALDPQAGNPAGAVVSDAGAGVVGP